MAYQKAPEPLDLGIIDEARVDDYMKSLSIELNAKGIPTFKLKDSKGAKTKFNAAYTLVTLVRGHNLKRPTGDYHMRDDNKEKKPNNGKWRVMTYMGKLLRENDDTDCYFSDAQNDDYLRQQMAAFESFYHLLMTIVTELVKTPTFAIAQRAATTLEDAIKKKYALKTDLAKQIVAEGGQAALTDRIASERALIPGLVDEYVAGLITIPMFNWHHDDHPTVAELYEQSEQYDEDSKELEKNRDLTVIRFSDYVCRLATDKEAPVVLSDADIAELTRMKIKGAELQTYLKECIEKKEGRLLGVPVIRKKQGGAMVNAWPHPFRLFDRQVPISSGDAIRVFFTLVCTESDGKYFIEPIIRSINLLAPGGVDPRDVGLGQEAKDDPLAVELPERFEPMESRKRSQPQSGRFDIP